jgi:hypothetical protein
MGNNGAIMELHNNSTYCTMTTEPAHTVKHICNSQKPTLKPKIAKELVCFPTLFCRPEKQNQVSAKIEN